MDANYITPEELVLRKERQTHAKEALSYLSKEERKVLLWRMETPPVTYVKIAERLGVCSATAWKRYKHAMKKVREHVNSK